jgi:hypothetical protein
MKKRLRVGLQAFLLATLLATIVVGQAGAGSPPNRLDPPSGGPVGIVGEACDEVLGPFKDVSEFFNLDVCPSASGRVLANPKIWNVFASDNWDATVPSNLSSAAINDLTRGIVDTTPGNDYLGAASQYGVGAAQFVGSSQNDSCTGAPSGTTNFVSILLWLTCEVQLPGTGIPYPDDNTLYVVYLPPSVDVNNGPFGGTCDGFSAYHFQSTALKVDWVTEEILGVDVPVPPFFHAHFQSYPFAVIPLKCAMDNLTMGSKRGIGPLRVDWVSEMASHEIVEAATDPIVPDGWLDRSTINFSDDVFKKGEAADICEGGGSAPALPRRLDNGILVSPYWSNSDNACAPVVHTLTLKTVGLPDGGTAAVTSKAIYGDPNGHTQTLPHTYCTDAWTMSFPAPAASCIVHNAHVKWSFPETVSGGTGIRYVTGNTGDDTFVDQDITSTATYAKQFFLTTNTAPGNVAALTSTLTPSQWAAAGSTVGITTDELVPSGQDRYRFDKWTGAGADPSNRSTNVLMDGPKTATANYVLQYLIGFDQTGIPAGVPWSVSVDGTDHSGPYSQWFDKDHSIYFTFPDTVAGLTPGVRYKLVSTDATSPFSATAKRTVTATYKTQYLLTVRTSGLPSPNLTQITNGTTTLGTANDSAPLGVWIDSGTALALAGDADVNGVDGTQYFAQDFAPAPPATMTGPFETTLTYKTMAQLIQDALAGGGIVGPNGPGVAKALTKQFAAVQADMGAKRYAPALGDLTAFVNLVKAQCCTPVPDKSITPPTARMLELDAMLVYHVALCLGTNQLSSKQMTDSYAYYTQLVSSLGGKVLPPCA